jgi:hypothetical protein
MNRTINLDDRNAPPSKLKPKEDFVKIQKKKTQKNFNLTK